MGVEWFPISSGSGLVFLGLPPGGAFHALPAGRGGPRPGRSRAALGRFLGRLGVSAWLWPSLALRVFVGGGGTIGTIQGKSHTSGIVTHFGPSPKIANVLFGKGVSKRAHVPAPPDTHGHPTEVTALSARARAMPSSRAAEQACLVAVVLVCAGVAAAPTGRLQLLVLAERWYVNFQMRSHAFKVGT